MALPGKKFNFQRPKDLENMVKNHQKVSQLAAFLLDFDLFFNFSLNDHRVVIVV